MSSAYIKSILGVLAANNIGLADFLVHLVQSHHNNPAVQQLFSHCEDVCEAFMKQKKCHEAMTRWTRNTAKTIYTQEVKNLTQKTNGWHFSAHTADIDSVINFKLEDMVKDMQRSSPGLWDLIYLLLGGLGDPNDIEVQKEVDGGRSTLPAVSRELDAENDRDEHDDEANDKLALINIVRGHRDCSFGCVTEQMCEEASCHH